MNEPGVQPSNPREKALLVAGLLLFIFGSYYAVGLLQDPARARSLATPLDDAIPFSAPFMWGYVIVYTYGLIPVFTVRCQNLFRRVCASYVVANALCLVCWLIYPVSAEDLRADLTQAEPTWFHEWGLRLNYDLDPSLNCFPSLHVAMAVLAAGCAWKARPAFGAAAAATAVLISVSTCLVKQHFALDVVGGAVVAAVAYFAVVHRYDTGDASPEELAYTWRGPACYLAVHASVILALYVAYLAGLKTW